ncbi:MAG: LysR family transcriptional regulator [Coriobacteriales bacterium]|jgi:DNA-binding transcriptional LysR family regulator|nr:LysR family transcriptional regulator [Coriobacteriales bacterium]
MRIEQLLHFLDVAETLSITRSASNLYITPQGLSQSIVNLEREYGLTLFDRTKTGLALNSKGQAFLELARELYQQYTEFEQRVAALTAHPEAEGESFYLYLPPLLSQAAVLQPLVERLGEAFPSCDFRIREVDLDGALSLFARADRETNSLALTTMPDFTRDEVTRPPGSEVRTIITLPIVARMRKDAPLAGRKMLKRKELAEQPLVCFNEPVVESVLYELVKDYGEPNLVLKGTGQVLGLHKDAVAVGVDILGGDEDIVSVPIMDTVMIGLDLLYASDAPTLVTQIADEIYSFIKSYYKQ